MDKILNIDHVFTSVFTNLIPIFFVAIGSAVFIYFFNYRDNKREAADKSKIFVQKRKKNNNVVENSLVANPTKSDNKAIKKEVVKKATTAGTTNRKGTNSSTATKKNAKQQQQQNTIEPIVANKKSKPVDKETEIGDGEWQTVITKKQKKTHDPLISAVAELAFVASAGETKLKQSTEVKKSKQTKNINKNIKDIIKPKVIEATISSSDFVETEMVSPALVPGTIVDNLVFDELADAEWIETKPQKKSKKRAQRE